MTPPEELRGEVDVKLGAWPPVRLCFRTYAYRIIENMTKVGHFQRLQTPPKEWVTVENLGIMIFAGGQKYHRVDPWFTLDAVNEQLNDLTGAEYLEVLGVVVKAFARSNMTPEEQNPTKPATATTPPPAP